MRFTIRLLRYKGRVLPWREVINRPSMRGDLRVEQVFDEERRCYVCTALLFDETFVNTTEGRPELREVRLVAMSPQAFTIAGLERIDGAEYAQSWIVTAG